MPAVPVSSPAFYINSLCTRRMQVSLISHCQPVPCVTQSFALPWSIGGRIAAKHRQAVGAMRSAG
jgi:hypothetical protein